jgi:hypothetical protein
MNAQLRTYVLEGMIKAVSPLATCSKDLKDREGRDNQPAPVPTTTTEFGKRLMFPSTGIRGALRRRARDILRNAAIAATGNETPFTLDEHYFLTLGGIKGEGAQERSTVAMESEWRNKNPLLSLFGAGDAGVLGFVQGHLSVGNAIACDVSDPVIFSGARTDDFYRDKAQVRYLSDADIASLVSRSKGGKDRSSLQAELKTVERDQKKAHREGKKELAEELRAKADALKANVETVKAESGTSDVSVGMPLAGWQAIPQGCKMDHRMLLVRSNQLELGFLLETLNAFAMDPILGAHFANGHGLVSGEWVVYEASLSGRSELGTVRFAPYTPIETAGAALQQARESFKNFLAGKEWDFSIPKVA